MTTASVSTPETRRPADAARVGGAAFLAAAAFGWTAGGTFTPAWARLAGVAAAALGAALVWLSYRVRRPAVVQYLVLPVAAAAGALVALPGAVGDTDLPGLVVEALRAGGLGEPPVAFDPGWRFLLVVLTTLLAAAGAALATALDRPRLAVAMPLPLLVGASLVQPPAGEIVSAAGSLVLLVAALGLCYGAELARDGASSGAFELRRLARGAAALVVAGGLVAGLGQLGFLFPAARDTEVIPPKRPEPAPPSADRVLFRAEAPRALTWRLGVLDVYEDGAWLTPPYDTGRLVGLPREGAVPGAPAAGDLSVTFTVADVPGAALPAVAAPAAVRRSTGDLTYDPRTQAVRSASGRPRAGLTYTLVAPAPPTGRELSAAPRPGAGMAEFLAVPEPPTEVAELLVGAPDDNLFARLQHVRRVFYTKVVAAGAGNPVDVPPGRVAEILRGREASPYEITAAEALVARWAGVPARVGYGWFGGDKRGSAFEVRPKHGATWLEVWFEGHGWVPLVGTPPRAKASLGDASKNNDPSVRPTDELAVVVYVPFRLRTIELLYVHVRYWAVRAIPWGLLALLGVVFYPVPLKALRRARRRRWARRDGPGGRVVAAYAELRDAVIDLNVGAPALTPLELARAIEPDPEHDQLAWLVTRAVWGDLARDLREPDVRAAEELSASVTRRLRRAQPAVTRILARASRASLREPWTREVPNLWPRRRRFRPRLSLRVPRPWGLARATLVLGLLMSACASPVDLRPGAAAAGVLPPRIVPDRVGGVTFTREAEAESAYAEAGADALVDRGLVYLVREGATVQASLQLAPFKPGLRSGARAREAREGVLRGIGGGRFEPTQVGTVRLFRLERPEQVLLLWFPPDGSYFELFVARRAFTQAEEVFASVLAYQQGDDVTGPVPAPRVVVPDPRRGAPA